MGINGLTIRVIGVINLLLNLPDPPSICSKILSPAHVMAACPIKARIPEAHGCPRGTGLLYSPQLVLKDAFNWATLVYDRRLLKELRIPQNHE